MCGKVAWRGGRLMSLHKKRRWGRNGFTLAELPSKEISDAGSGGELRKARRGSALAMTLTMMVFFAIVCVVVIGMAQTNVNYYFFFEHRGILKQATLSFAETLVESIRKNRDVWWSGDSDALAHGSWLSEVDVFYLPMRFNYFVSPDKNDIYTLVVSGEYVSPRENYVAWGVSVDIDILSSGDRDIWEEIKQLWK
jgi:hypothetical protein